MIDTAPTEVLYERMQMAYGDTGLDPSLITFNPNRLPGGVEMLGGSPVMFWRAAQICGSEYVNCFRCWLADAMFYGRFCASCDAPRGVYDCGRTDR